MLDKKAIKIYCDGGARGNPGPAAAAFVVEESGKIIFKKSKYLGTATNNVAEYSALVMALSWARDNLSKLKNTEAVFVLDSELVAKQMSGVFKIKNENLRRLYLLAKKIEGGLGGRARYLSVSREKNKLADFLVNKELDEASGR